MKDITLKINNLRSWSASQRERV